MLCVVLEKWENDNKECNNQPKYRGGNNVSGGGSGSIENWGEMRKNTMTAYNGRRRRMRVDLREASKEKAVMHH